MPFESSGLFEAGTVVGALGVSTISTQLAEVGYALTARKIETFNF
jgi:hypothetical protein